MDLQAWHSTRRKGGGRGPFEGLKLHGDELGQMIIEEAREEKRKQR